MVVDPQTQLDRSADVSPFRRQIQPVLFLAVIFFVNFTARIILAPLLPTIEADLGIRHSMAGSFFFLISAGYFTSLLGSGFFSVHFTHRTVIVVSVACVGLGLLAISLAKSIWGIRLGLLIMGAAAGLYIPSAIATITSLTDKDHWGKDMGVHELAPNLAFLVAPALAELLLKWFTWRSALGVLGVSAIVISSAFALYGRGGAFHGEAPSSGSFGVLLRTPSFWLVLWLFGLGVSSTLGVFTMLPLYLVSERGMEQAWANSLLALSRAPGPVLALAGGWASDKLGAKLTMALSLLISGSATLSLGLVPDAWLWAVLFIQPLVAVCFFPAGFATLARIAPAGGRNLAVSLVTPCGFVLGGGAVPTFIGMMGDAGLFSWGFVLVGLLLLLGAGLALTLKVSNSS